MHQVYKVPMKHNTGGSDCLSQTPSEPLGKQVVAVFPFVDKRVITDDTIVTGIPLSTLLPEYFINTGNNCRVFKQIGFAPLSVYENKVVDMSPSNFKSITAQCGSTAVMWGEIDDLSIVYDSKIKSTFKAEITVSGFVKVMFSQDKAPYVSRFSYSKVFEGNKSFFQDPVLTNVQWGQEYEELFETAASRELLRLVVSYKNGISLKNPNLPVFSDVLTYSAKPENMLCYDKNYNQQRAMVITFTGLAGMVIGSYIVAHNGKDYSGGAAPLGGLQGLGDFVIGFFGGYLSGVVLGWAVSDIFFSEGSVFYAKQPSLSPDVILSMNVLYSRF